MSDLEFTVDFEYIEFKKTKQAFDRSVLTAKHSITREEFLKLCTHYVGLASSTSISESIIKNDPLYKKAEIFTQQFDMTDVELWSYKDSVQTGTSGYLLLEDNRYIVAMLVIRS